MVGREGFPVSRVNTVNCLLSESYDGKYEAV